MKNTIYIIIVQLLLAQVSYSYSQKLIEIGGGYHFGINKDLANDLSKYLNMEIPEGNSLFVDKDGNLSFNDNDINTTSWKISFEFSDSHLQAIEDQIISEIFQKKLIKTIYDVDLYDSVFLSYNFKDSTINIPDFLTESIPLLKIANEERGIKLRLDQPCLIFSERFLPKSLKDSWKEKYHLTQISTSPEYNSNYDIDSQNEKQDLDQFFIKHIGDFPKRIEDELINPHDLHIELDHDVIDFSNCEIQSDDSVSLTIKIPYGYIIDHPTIKYEDTEVVYDILFLKKTSDTLTIKWTDIEYYDVFYIDLSMGLINNHIFDTLKFKLKELYKDNKPFSVYFSDQINPTIFNQENSLNEILGFMMNFSPFPPEVDFDSEELPALYKLSRFPLRVNFFLSDNIYNISFNQLMKKMLNGIASKLNESDYSKLNNKYNSNGLEKALEYLNNKNKNIFSKGYNNKSIYFNIYLDPSIKNIETITEKHYSINYF